MVHNHDTTTPRWENDSAGRGMGDGRAFAPDVQNLIREMDRDGWVAEDPHLHLLPHLQRACEVADSPWTLGSAAMDGSVYRVNLLWEGGALRMGHVRADAYALIGQIAESISCIHQIVRPNRLVFQVTTGMLPGDTPFEPHGHLLELVITGPAVERALAGSRGTP